MNHSRRKMLKQSAVAALSLLGIDLILETRENGLITWIREFYRKPRTFDEMLMALRAYNLPIVAKYTTDLKSKTTYVFVPEDHNRDNPANVQRVAKAIAALKPDAVGLEGIVGLFSEQEKQEWVRLRDERDADIHNKKNTIRFVQAIENLSNIVAQTGTPLSPDSKEQIKRAYWELYTTEKLWCAQHYLAERPGLAFIDTCSRVDIVIGMESQDSFEKGVALFGAKILRNNQAYHKGLHQAFQQVHQMLEERLPEQKKLAMRTALTEVYQIIDGIKAAMQQRSRELLTSAGQPQGVSDERMQQLTDECTLKQRSYDWVANMSRYLGVVFLIGGRDHNATIYAACKEQNYSVICLDML